MVKRLRGFRVAGRQAGDKQTIQGELHLQTLSPRRIRLIAGEAVLVIPALVMALFALSSALIAEGWSQPLSYLTSAILAAVLSGVLLAIGIHRLDARKLAPRETIKQLEKDKDTAKGMVRRTTPEPAFFDSLIAAARENPLSAARVGGGALWLLIGDEKLKGAARSAVSAASDAVDSGSSALRATATSAQRTAVPSAAPEWGS